MILRRGSGEGLTRGEIADELQEALPNAPVGTGEYLKVTVLVSVRRGVIVDGALSQRRLSHILSNSRGFFVRAPKMRWKLG